MTAIANVLHVATRGDYAAQMPKFDLAQRQVDDTTHTDLDAIGSCAWRTASILVMTIANVACMVPRDAALPARRREKAM